MKATYQYQFYPDTNQKLTLNQWLRICRYWYNRQLGDRFDWWEMNRTAINACPLKTSIAAPREKPNYYSQKQQLPILKKDLVKVVHDVYLATSEGEKLPSLKPLRKNQSKLARISTKRNKRKRGSKSRRKLAKKEAKQHQKIARSRQDFHYKTAHKLVRSGAKFFFHEDLNLKGLTKRNKVKQDEDGKYLPNGQSAKSGLNKSWQDAAFGQFFKTLDYIAAKAGAVVISQKPAYTSMVLSYRNEIIFTDCSIRDYWDEQNSLMVDRDINAAINLKRLGLGIFPSIKRRSGNLSIVGTIDNSTAKEILHTLHRAAKKPTSYLYSG